MTLNSIPSKPCPCGRNKSYNTCCGVLHRLDKSATTAEDLMRSRYAAFVLALGDYLMYSHHSSTRPTNDKTDIENWAKSVKWKGLVVKETVYGGELDNEGIVEFTAHFKEAGRNRKIEERSKFVKEDKRWVYLGLDGDKKEKPL